MIVLDDKSCVGWLILVTFLWLYLIILTALYRSYHQSHLLQLCIWLTFPQLRRKQRKLAWLLSTRNHLQQHVQRWYLLLSCHVFALPLMKKCCLSWPGATVSWVWDDDGGSLCRIVSLDQTSECISYSVTGDQQGWIFPTLNYLYGYCTENKRWSQNKTFFL